MQPKNPNTLQPNGFFATINRLPNISYWCNSVTLPGISASNPDQSNPFSRLPVPGDRADFDQLTLVFNVDEDLKNWTEVMRWFVGFTFPRDFADFTFGILDDSGDFPGSDKNFYSDISVTVLSSHKNPIATFIFYNCVPTTLSGIDLTVATQDVSPISATVTFDFSHFDILKPASTDQVSSLE